MSADGNLAVFVSDTSNVVSGMTQNDNGTDVYLRNLATEKTELVSVNAAGTGTGNGSSSLFLPAVSPPTAASSPSGAAGQSGFRHDDLGHEPLHPRHEAGGYQLGCGFRKQHRRGTGDGREPAFSGNDQFLTFANASGSVFVYNVTNGSIRLVSYTPDGTPGNGASSDPVISSDGSTVVFVSAATDLVSGAGQYGGDLFLFNNQVRRLRPSSNSVRGSPA